MAKVKTTRRVMICDACEEKYAFDAEVDEKEGPLTSPDAREWRQSHARSNEGHQRFTVVDEGSEA